MGTAVHIKPARGGWAVVREGSRRASSVHRTQAEAEAAGQRLARKTGGTEVVIHFAHGSIESSKPIGPARTRAPRSEGPRTTLRLPESLASVADRLADELGISRNDAVLRLATRGARLYEQERAIAARREERWAAVVPGAIDVDLNDLPSPEEARAAIVTSRDD